MNALRKVAFCSVPGNLLPCSRLRLFRNQRYSRHNRRNTSNVVRACSNSSNRLNPTVITTPLYYVNAPPHIGSAYPTIATDALARFIRLSGDDVCFITGVDQHGEKIAQAAAKAGKEPEQFCEEMTGKFVDLWDQLDVKYDKFVRTTSVRHKKIVREFMERVWNNGDIYKSQYEGLYCTDCEEYKDEKDLQDGNMCPIHLRKCELRKEENYFFALSRYQEKLERFLENNLQFVVPENRRNEVLNWVKSGVRDFSVSRAHNPWGIPVPRDESQTIYVWFDALLGYISALLPEDDKNASLHDALARGWPAAVHVIGKDILRFHAIYWPAMLMAAGVELPKKVFGHGFITKDGLKMGKSLGNTVNPKELVETYGSDAVRYYFLKAVDFGRDGDFSEKRFVDIVNADLANSLGNMLNRTLNLLRKYCNSTLPLSSAIEVSSDEDEQCLRKSASEASIVARRAYAELDFITACEAFINVSTQANVYIDSVAPWFALKSEDESEVHRGQRALVNCIEAVRIVAVGLSPVTTELSRKIYEALELGDEFDKLHWDDLQWGKLTANHYFGSAKPRPVFPRMDQVAASKPEPAAVV